MSIFYKTRQDSDWTLSLTSKQTKTCPILNPFHPSQMNYTTLKMSRNVIINFKIVMNWVFPLIFLGIFLKWRSHDHLPPVHEDCCTWMTFNLLLTRTQSQIKRQIVIWDAGKMESTSMSRLNHHTMRPHLLWSCRCKHTHTHSFSRLSYELKRNWKAPEVKGWIIRPWDHISCGRWSTVYGVQYHHFSSTLWAFKYKFRQESFGLSDFKSQRK